MKKKLDLVCDNSAICNLEKQANQQSYTLGHNQEILQKIRECNDWMFVHGIYGRKIYKIYAKRIVNKAIKYALPMHN